MATSDDLRLALELCELADAITLGRFRATDLVVERKPDMTPVTEADRGVEAALRERLERERPADGVLGEEFGATAADRARRWVIDPIDGTKSYVRGIPVWATLIALLEGAEPLVAAVSAPALERRWWAERGGGAWGRDPLGREPRRLQVSAIREFEDAQLCFSGLKGWGEQGHPRLLALADRCWRSRAFGDFWSYMLVAEGAAEIATEPEVSLWDLAAPMLVVEEAGGRFTDLSGERRADGGDVLATNGHLHDATLTAIGRAVAG